METKQPTSILEKFVGHFGYKNLKTIDPIGYSGGMALFYNQDDFQVSILFESNRLIDIEAVFKGRIIHLTFVYGDPVPKNRDMVWERLLRISSNRSTPWFLVGDFNELTGNHEKRGGGELHHPFSFLSFNGMIRDCGFLEFPFIGDCLSWRGWRDKKPIRCRLARALGNEDWHDLFPDTVTEYLPMIASDHKPLVVNIGAKRPRGKRSFMFDRCWIGKAGLMDAIASRWDRDLDQDSDNFVQKVVNCRKAVSQWRKSQVPYGRETIEDLKRQLEVALADDSIPPSTISELQNRLRQAYGDEEIYWYQKSWSKWMKLGDKNSKYFHALTKQRRARNRITGLFNRDDIWSTEDVDICHTAVSYFEDLFTSTNPENFEEVLREVNTVITAEDNEWLTGPATEAEVKSTLFTMHPDKAPGPNGMTALFFQKAWDIVKTDLVDLVNRFLVERVFDKDLNRTHICLIPKVAKPTRMAELRPISLCNVGYKIISKILCQRLKRVLPGLISETQSAFVPGRLISDNILIAQEMFHGLRTNPSCKGKFMAIKTDMSKAYDRVEWDFVAALLQKMGFAESWVSWIMFCVTSVEYRVRINGQPNGLIVPQRGLRQGDPLSPYLFILCTEVLIANIRKAEREKLITGIKVANKCPPITHLLFADDSLFFCKVDRGQCRVILDILKQYESVSGLPESLGGAKTKVFSFVRERIQSRTNGWTANLLSKGGREVMIKSVATAVPTFVMSSFRLPKTITSKLTSAVANFWWSTNGQTGGMHWLAWEKLCVSKQLGGLGFRNVDDFNSALLAKQLWRLIDVPESLFARVFKSRYYRNTHPLDPIRSYSPSYGWRSICSARSLVNKGLIKRVGSGDTISIWSDPWVPAQFPRPASSKGPLKDPSLQMNQLIDRQNNSWRLDMLNEHFDPLDVALIRAIPLGGNQRDDPFGWHFTKTGNHWLWPGNYPLLASVWRARCPPKIQHFMWQVLSGCISVSANLGRRGIACDVRCVRCGADSETINHAIFVCPPARQVWALANVPVGPNSFPTESVYANVDHFLGQQNPGAHIAAFPWLMWFIWKARNARVFDNIAERPEDIVRVAEGEAAAWQQAQIEDDLVTSPTFPVVSELPVRVPTVSLPSVFSGYRCFIAGSWKAGDLYAGAGWCCTSIQTTLPFLGAKNFRRSLSPLHTEVEAFLWAMRCMIGHDFREVAFYTDCSDLVKMVSSPSDWPAFSAYLDDIKTDREEFSSFSLSLIPRNANLRADSLARQACTSPHQVLFVNDFPTN
ncbi:PREDICTED: uncharacterized protein LOC104768075 [Camelina sativa]|uniref:Uncharacterized protein LOC104768075 n=1 Tax=Camelina sativa TaxID=90675 RepID=A0ABM1RBX9_CAMSA|nr:PREDICTED: uncharacterized protein LOC104768075 [Camelina sativa]